MRTQPRRHHHNKDWFYDRKTGCITNNDGFVVLQDENLAEANGYLISAAPHMHVALEQVEKYLLEHVEEYLIARIELRTGREREQERERVHDLLAVVQSALSLAEPPE
jgi:hypothetical protein